MQSMFGVQALDHLALRKSDIFANSAKLIVCYQLKPQPKPQKGSVEVPFCSPTSNKVELFEFDFVLQYVSETAKYFLQKQFTHGG